MAKRLYPPQLDGTLPAFTGATVVVPFAMNKAVSLSEVTGFRLKIKTTLNDILINDNAPIESTNFTNSSVTFDISSIIDKLKIGNYYKFQIAYVDQDEESGYFSTVGVIKYTTKPTVAIKNLVEIDGNATLVSYIGEYSQYKLNENYDNINDVTEKVAYYKYEVYDLNDVLIEDSNWILHSSLNDLYNHYSTDEFTIKTELTPNTPYFLRYITKSKNGLITKSPRYQIVNVDTVEPDLDAILQAKLNYDNGYIHLSFKDKMIGGAVKNALGSFFLDRYHDGKWETISKFILQGEKPSSWEFNDMTIEQGITYTYAYRQYSEITGIYSIRRNMEEVYDYAVEDYIPGDEIYADFEDAFLYDGERQLNIKYNPKVSTFKTDIIEQKLDTLGSKFPFIFRNGHTNYKEFAISGLISYLSDSEGLFTSVDVDPDENNRIQYIISNEPFDENITYYLKLNNGLFRPVSITASRYAYGKYYIKFMESKEIKTKDIPQKLSTTNLVDYNIANERKFKLEVLDWLNNGKPKLFRSPAEGNYIIRLMNNSLSPTDSISRMLHTFNSSAYEIADYNYDNMVKFGFINNEDLDTTRVYYKTFDLVDIIDNDNVLKVQNIINVPSATSVEFYDMTPGTILTINDNNRFVIGVTGTLILNNLDEPITKIEFNPNSFFVNSYPKKDYIEQPDSGALIENPVQTDLWQPYGYVVVGYTAEGNAAFDKIKNITIKSYPCRQFFGNKMPYKKAVGDYDLTKQYYSYDRLDGTFTSMGYLTERSYYRNEYYEPDDIFKNLDLINVVIENPTFKFINLIHAKFIKRNTIDIYYFGENYENDITTRNYSDFYWDPYKSKRLEESDFDPYTIFRVRAQAEITNELIEDQLPDWYIRGRDYYLDRQLNKFFPITGSYIDGRIPYAFRGQYYDAEKECYVQDPKFYTVTIGEDEKDLSVEDIETFEIWDFKPEELSQLLIGPGVVAECTYIGKEIEYNFDYKEKDEYFAARNNLKEALNSQVTDTEAEGSLSLDTYEANVQQAYTNLQAARSNYIDKTIQLLKEYDIEHGLAKG